MTTLRTSDPDVDRAFALAAAQAEAMVRRGGDLTDRARSRLASALLGAGIRAPARELLRRRGRRPDASGDIEALTRSYSAWVGDDPGSEETSAAPPDEPAAIREAAAALAGNPEDPIAVARMLEAAISGVWGVMPDARAGAVSLRPELPDDWRSMALTRLRVGPTVLDLELRRSRAGLVMHVRRVTGPALVATVEPRPPLPGPTLVDDVELAGPRARFEVTGRHELGFRGPAR